MRSPLSRLASDAKLGPWAFAHGYLLSPLSRRRDGSVQRVGHSMVRSKPSVPGTERVKEMRNRKPPYDSTSNPSLCMKS